MRLIWPAVDDEHVHCGSQLPGAPTATRCHGRGSPRPWRGPRPPRRWKPAWTMRSSGQPSPAFAFWIPRSSTGACRSRSAARHPSGAAVLDPWAVGRVAHRCEEVRDHLVAVGGHPEPLPAGEQVEDHPWFQCRSCRCPAGPCTGSSERSSTGRSAGRRPAGLPPFGNEAPCRAPTSGCLAPGPAPAPARGWGPARPSPIPPSRGEDRAGAARQRRHRRHRPFGQPGSLAPGDAGDQREGGRRHGSCSAQACCPLADAAVLDRLRVGVRRGGGVSLEPLPNSAVVRRVLRHPEAGPVLAVAPAER